MSELTVPVSRADPGRAARTVPQVRSEFGDAIEIYAAGVKAAADDMLDREMQRLTVDMTRDLNDLRLQVEQIGDPDAAEAAWSQGVASLRTGYEQPDATGRVRLSQPNRDRFGIAFDSLANRHAFAVGARNIDLRRSQREANFIAYTHAAQQSYATGDEGIRTETLTQLDGMVDADVASGRIDPAEGERRKQAFRAEGDNARAIRMIGDDPAAFQAARKAGEFSGLGAEVLAQYDVKAESALRRAAEEQAREAEKARKERDAALDAGLDEVIAVAGKGQISTDEGLLTHPDVMSRPKWAEAQAAIQLRDEGVLLAQMTPRELRALYDAEMAKPKSREYQTARANVIKRYLDAAEKGYGADPVAYAASVGLDVPPLPAFDPADPVAFGRAVQQRVLMGEALQRDGYTRSLRYFTNEEREMLRAQASPDADPDTRAALAYQLSLSLSGASPDTVKEFGFDDVFVQMGEVQAMTGNSRLAAEISRGQQALEAKNVILPPAKDRLGTAFDHVAATFAGLPNGQEEQRRLFAAADALYAARQQITDPDGAINTAAYRQALHEVMGGTGDWASKLAEGGLQNVKDALTRLPVGVSALQVEEAIIELRKDLSGIQSPINPKAERDAAAVAAQTGVVVRPITRLTEDQAKARGTSILQAASVSGGLPGINGEPIAPDEIDDFRIIPAGGDTYVLTLDGAAVTDLTTGKLWRFDLRRLIEGAAR